MLYIILVQDFCPPKIKITQCPGGFHPKALYSKEKLMIPTIDCK